MNFTFVQNLMVIMDQGNYGSSVSATKVLTNFIQGTKQYPLPTALIRPNAILQQHFQ